MDKKEPVSYEEYYTTIYSPGVLGYLKKYTLGLPGVVPSLFRADAETRNSFLKEIKYYLSPKRTMI